jgi:hypothetical protein
MRQHRLAKACRNEGALSTVWSSRIELNFRAELLPTARLPSPASSSGRPSRTYVERKTLTSGIFPGVHVNHLYGLWLGSRNERIVVQQQNRFDYPYELTARHRFWHRDRNGQGIRGKAAIPDQGITCQLFVFLKDRVNARIVELQGLKVAKADFSAKPGTVLHRWVNLTSTVNGDNLRVVERPVEDSAGGSLA